MCIFVARSTPQIHYFLVRDMYVCMYVFANVSRHAWAHAQVQTTFAVFHNVSMNHMYRCIHLCMSTLQIVLYNTCLCTIHICLCICRCVCNVYMNHMYICIHSCMTTLYIVLYNTHVYIYIYIYTHTHT